MNGDRSEDGREGGEKTQESNLAARILPRIRLGISGDYENVVDVRRPNGQIMARVWLHWDAEDPSAYLPTLAIEILDPARAVNETPVRPGVRAKGTAKRSQ